MPDPAFWPTLAAFAATYVGLAAGRWPGVRTDRAGIALVGAAAVLAAGGLTVGRAAAAVDVPTLATLLGMMLLAADLERGGVFDRLVERVRGFARTPRRWLAVVVAESAKKAGAGFGFAAFCAVGVPVTLLTLAIAWGRLALVLG